MSGGGTRIKIIGKLNQMYLQLLKSLQKNESAGKKKLLLDQFHSLLRMNDQDFEDDQLATILAISNHFNKLQEEHFFERPSTKSTRDPEPTAPTEKLDWMEEIGTEHKSLTSQDQPLIVSKVAKQRLKVLQELRDCEHKLLQAYRQHVIDEAAAALQRLEELGRFVPEAGQTLSRLQTLVARVKEQKQTVDYLDQKIASKDWQLKQCNSEDKLFMAEEEGAVGMKILSRQRISVKDFLALICEVALFNKYVPFCDVTNELAAPARNEKLGYAHIRLPVIANRQLVFHALGYNRLRHNGSLLFLSKTVQTDKQALRRAGLEPRGLSPGHEWLDYKYYAIEYSPAEDGFSNLTICCCMDMHMNYLPTWVISLGVRQFASDYFKDMLACTRKFQPWRQQIKKKAQFYDYFDGLIREFGLK